MSELLGRSLDGYIASETIISNEIRRFLGFACLGYADIPSNSRKRPPSIHFSALYVVVCLYYNRQCCKPWNKLIIEDSEAAGCYRSTSDQSAARTALEMCKQSMETAVQLADRCGVSDLTNYNSGNSFCATLRAGQHTCCSEGNLPHCRPEPNSEGLLRYCYSSNDQIRWPTAMSRKCQEAWRWMGHILMYLSKDCT